MKFLLSFFLLAILPLPLLAQGQKGAQKPATQNQAAAGQTGAAPPAIWSCQLPGGKYDVAVSAITSVSSHQYVVDAVARVTEVNIDTAGAVVARFYYIEPNTPNSGPASLAASSAQQMQALLTQTSSATGADVWQKVVKNYPVTTHAHTVEFRLSTSDQLQALFNSVENSFRTGAPGQYTSTN